MITLAAMTASACRTRTAQAERGDAGWLAMAGAARWGVHANTCILFLKFSAARCIAGLAGRRAERVLLPANAAFAAAAKETGERLEW